VESPDRLTEKQIKAVVLKSRTAAFFIAPNMAFKLFSIFRRTSGFNKVLVCGDTALKNIDKGRINTWNF
jgi:hypothetical protein